MKKPVRVRIFDQEYLIRSDEDEEKVQKIAEYINTKLRQVRESLEGLSEGKAAILASFHIANEYFNALEERAEIVGFIQEHSRSLVHRLEAVAKRG